MLYHFSEDPAITRFEPLKLQSRPELPAMVWTIDEEHAPHYYFPRECPRVCIWADAKTTDEDVERFFGHSATRHVLAIEADWLERMRETKLYRYAFHEQDFALHDANAGYHTSMVTVIPAVVDPVGDLITRIVSCGHELRITPSLMPLQEAVLRSTVNFSMIRMRNAKK
ncbi:DUF6886 family protein [Paenibacillus cremeus]|uniref:Uncharacterized protein n=1 Tax=Paenibacillus cremeus TaxID=2163881 RepID=A0A559KEJ2_9BACL|nr:DUF6886 family protein [Paenibacillus cremeus]TVY10544.1 hypothetical protein FPZ49_07355 [Paenibacillus cremeus]